MAWLGRLLAAWRLWRDPTRLVVWVVGENMTADRVRAALLTRPGYVVSPVGAWLTLQIEEAAIERIVVDGVMTRAEAYVMRAIAEQSPTGEYLVYRTAGQNFDDAKLRLIVPADDRWRVAVQEGVVTGLDQLRQSWRKGRP